MRKMISVSEYRTNDKIELTEAGTERLRGDLDSYAATGRPLGGFYPADTRREVFINFATISRLYFLNVPSADPEE